MLDRERHSADPIVDDDTLAIARWEDDGGKYEADAEVELHRNQTAVFIGEDGGADNLLQRNGAHEKLAGPHY